MATAHQQAIHTKHQALDARIEEERHRPLPDTGLMAKLKREKLRLKDELVGH